MPLSPSSSHDELHELRADVVRLAALASEAVPRGTEALLRMDLEAAQQLIEDDDLADALTVSIEERCDQLLTGQHPVAIDLREVITILRVAGDLERSIDLMVNVAKSTRRIYGSVFRPRLSGLIEQMSEQSANLLRLAVDSYAERDAPLAAALNDMDGHLDELGHEYMHAVFEAHGSGGGLPVPVCGQLALIGQYYRRIGDHAVIIAERVQYMVTGWRPEQSAAARVRLRQAQALAVSTVSARLTVAPPAHHDGTEPGPTDHDGMDP